MSGNLRVLHKSIGRILIFAVLSMYRKFENAMIYLCWELEIDYVMYETDCLWMKWQAQDLGHLTHNVVMSMLL